MLCEKCQKKNATHKITQNINGNQTKINICGDCAKEYGINDFEEIISSSFGFSDFINSFFNFDIEEQLEKTSSNQQVLKCCPVCQKSFDDIAKNGKMGCATCYTFFKNEILPIIEKIHGKTKHIGLVPLSADNDIKAKHEIQSLEKQLKDAIATQNFETAVVLRDKISNLKNKTDNKIIIDSNDDNSTPKSSR